MKEIKLLESLTGKKVILKENRDYMGTAGEKFVISGGSGGNRPPLWQIFKAESPFTRVDMMFDDRSDAEDFATKRGFVLVDGFIEDELKEGEQSFSPSKIFGSGQRTTAPIATFTFGFDLNNIIEVEEYLENSKFVGPEINYNNNQYDNQNKEYDYIAIVERGDDTMNALYIFNQELADDLQLLDLIGNCEGEGSFDEDEYYKQNETDEDLEESTQASKSLLQNFQAAYRKRMQDKENIDNHNEVEKAIVNLVVAVGMPESEANQTPWMEDEMFSGSEDIKSVTEYLKEMLQDIQQNQQLN